MLCRIVINILCICLVYTCFMKLLWCFRYQTQCTNNLVQKIKCFNGLTLWIMRLLLLIAPCNGLQGAVAQYVANQTRNTGANPFYYDKCTGFLYVHYTTHWTNGFTSLPKNKASKQNSKWPLFSPLSKIWFSGI